MTVFTIGYGGRSPTEFVELLKQHGIATVVDVRLRPDRASMGIWVKAKTPEKGIENLLRGAGIGYVSHIELGNVFLDLKDWPERYRELLERCGDLLTARLEGVPQPFCLLCAEKDAARCHRVLIADYLAR